MNKTTSKISKKAKDRIVDNRREFRDKLRKLSDKLRGVGVRRAMDADIA